MQSLTAPFPGRGKDGADNGHLQPYTDSLECNDGSQPDVSRLLRGDFREYSLERLLRLLTALGRDIDIVIRQPRSAAGGRLRIAVPETV